MVVTRQTPAEPFLLRRRGQGRQQRCNTFVTTPSSVGPSALFESQSSPESRNWWLSDHSSGRTSAAELTTKFTASRGMHPVHEFFVTH